MITRKSRDEIKRMRHAGHIVALVHKKMKEVIILYEFEDYSYEKIAQKLKIPEGTVKSRLNNARKILKEKLQFLINEDNQWKNFY